MCPWNVNNVIILISFRLYTVWQLYKNILESTKSNVPRLSIFSCSTQLSMKFIMLTVVGILTFVSRINTTSECWSTKKSISFSILVSMSSWNCMFSWEKHEKSFITFGPYQHQPKKIKQSNLVYIFYAYTSVWHFNLVIICKFLQWIDSTDSIRHTSLCLYAEATFCKIHLKQKIRERSGAVVECLTWDRGLTLTSLTALWSSSKTHLS